MAKVKWPGGYADFYYKIRVHAKALAEGTVLSIDPASGGSSMPGFALFHAGDLQMSGTIDLPKKAPIDQRLHLLYEKIQAVAPTTPDVFAIELIRGRMAHFHLLWAVGTSIAASKAPVTLEVPILVWKALAKAEGGIHVKGDEADAILIGRSIILLAREAISEHPPVLPTRKGA